jgi:FAD/FMN-containing dehydrogenase
VDLAIYLESTASWLTIQYKYVYFQHVVCIKFIAHSLQVSIVTADGSILTASESENADLFWAVRGSGSNFGVVTEFVLRLHSQRPTVFSGNLIYLQSALKAIMKVLKERWQDGVSEKESMLQFLAVGPDGQVSER